MNTCIQPRTIFLHCVGSKDENNSISFYSFQSLGWPIYWELHCQFIKRHFYVISTFMWANLESKHLLKYGPFFVFYGTYFFGLSRLLFHILIILEIGAWQILLCPWKLATRQAQQHSGWACKFLILNPY